MNLILINNTVLEEEGLLHKIAGNAHPKKDRRWNNGKR